MVSILLFLAFLTQITPSYLSNVSYGIPIITSIEPPLGVTTGNTNISVFGMNISENTTISSLCCFSDEKNSICVPSYPLGPEALFCFSPPFDISTGVSQQLVNFSLTITQQNISVNSNSFDYLYYVEPILRDFNPKKIKVDSYVQIEGNNFFESDKLVCGFGLQKIYVHATFINNTNIQCQIPPITSVVDPDDDMDCGGDDDDTPMQLSVSENTYDWVTFNNSLCVENDPAVGSSFPYLIVLVSLSVGMIILLLILIVSYYHRKKSIKYNEVNLMVIRLIGKSKEGETYLLWQRKTGLYFAAKQLYSPIPETYLFYSHILYLKELPPHPNLIRYLGVTEPSRKILCEYMSLGNLQTYLQSLKQNQSYGKTLKILHSVSSAMTHLHNLSILHHSLNSRNVLVDLDESVKVCDYGLWPVNQAHTFPVRWTAPEVLRDSHSFSYAGDIFSFSILMYEVVIRCANKPYFPWTKEEVIAAVCDENYRLEQPVECTDELYSLMKRCWAKESLERPRFNDIKSELELLMENHKRRKGTLSNRDPFPSTPTHQGTNTNPTSINGSPDSLRQPLLDNRA